MCLTCMNYYDCCDEPECVAEAKAVDWKLHTDEYFKGKSGTELFLYTGSGLPPCKHMKEGHVPDCDLTDCYCYLS